jgi:Ca2+-binding RTX toxin-like protein
MGSQQRRTTVSRLAVTTSLLAVGVSPLLLAGSAQAVAAPAVATLSGQYLTYQAAPGQTNHLTVTRSVEGLPNDGSGYGTSRFTYTLDDIVSIKITDTDRCSYPTSTDTTKVVCVWIVEDGQDPGYISNFTLGDMNDTVTFVNSNQESYNDDQFDLGSGNDTYTSSKLADGSRIVGGSGNDKVTVDSLIGDLASVHGGTGNDTLRVNNGDLEFINGDAGNDTLYGGNGIQYLSGDDGNDVIHGGVGPDQITGGKGNDTLYGDHGDDTIYGNSGNDKLYGGQGADTLSGGAGKDVVKQN